MRAIILTVLGIGSIILGGLILSGKVRSTASSQTIDLGVIQATAQTRERLPDWAGYAALGVGVVLLVAGGRRRD